MSDEPVIMGLAVTSYDEAIAFYCETTGLFELAFDQDFGSGYRHVQLVSRSCGCFRLCLHLVDAVSNPLRGVQAAANLAVPVTDCEGLAASLKASGFAAKLVEAPYELQLQFEDPFGHRLCASQQY